MKAAKPSGKQQEQIQLAIALHQNGRINEAEALYKKLLKHFPRLPQLVFGYGVLSLQKADFEQSLIMFDRFLLLNSNHPSALCNRGLSLKELGRQAEALNCYDKAIALHPDFALAHFNRGIILQELQDYPNALLSFEQTVKIDINHAEAHNNCGYILQLTQQFAAALASYERALALKPDYIEAKHNRATVLKELKRFAEAVTEFDQTIALHPNYAAAYLHRGLTWHELGKYNDAIVDFTQAISLKPNYAEAYLGLGNAQKALYQYDEAIKNIKLAQLINPQYLGSYLSLSNVLLDLLKLDEALENLEHALFIKADYAQALYNKAIIKLLQGHYREGWLLYEWRWATEMLAFKRFSEAQRWHGDATIVNKRLLIYPEQGYGDFLQFCRYLPLLEPFKAKIILETPVPLLTLINTLPGNYELIAQGQPLPEFDLHCPIMSLPMALKTDINSIPADTPYLSANPEKQLFWQQRLGSKTCYRIGLVWSGSSIHKNDANRSIPLLTCTDLLNMAFEFHSLQKDIRPEDGLSLDLFPQLQLHHDYLHDFSDTAALINQMDLIITVDTAIAHLAGAMAKPVWILLPFSPDFRWLLNQSNSPWYPSATLYRQPHPQNWLEVLNIVCKDLNQLSQNSDNSNC